MPIDIDETVFSEHPKLKTGTKLGMLKGSPTYEAEKNLVQAFRDAVDNNLNNEREISLATYQWMSEGDENNPVSLPKMVFVDSVSITDFFPRHRPGCCYKSCETHRFTSQ